jgi:tRNA threonylcarbamoyladenosine biosynthesis protein TsaB
VIVLGLDTATSATAVALQAPGEPARELRDDPAAGAHPGHAPRLLGLAAELLGAAGLSWRQVDRIAVGVGPGTFTGLRVGIASARGLAQALEAELVGVSSLAALAHGAMGSGIANDGRPPAAQATGSVLAVIDARRGEVFAAVFQRGGDGLPRALAPARAVGPEAIATVLPGTRPEWTGRDAGAAAETDNDFGGLSGVPAVGDGAVRYRSVLEAAGASVAPDAAPEHLIRGSAVCALGAAAKPGDRHAVAPDYVRRPDAELALEGTG